MNNRIVTSLCVLCASLCAVQMASAQGSLTPPGAPVPTMKSLDQIEPRTPISSLPYVILQPGSYYLTTNLSCASCYGITIVTGGVTLDLNGFELAGTPSAFAGIYVNGVRTNIVIRNGALRNWPLEGVHAPTAVNTQWERLLVSNNGSEGILAGIGSTVSGCTVNTNRAGIVVGDGSIVNDCTANGNVGQGIYVTSGCSVKNCVADNNGSGGIAIPSGAGGSTVDGCTARSNGSDGIYVNNSCRVVDNTCDGNGTSSGIHIAGIYNRIEGNHVTSNNHGISVDGTKNVILRNSAGNNGINYVFVPGQTFGPTNNLVGTDGMITNQSPWANFSN